MNTKPPSDFCKGSCPKKNRAENEMKSALKKGESKTWISISNNFEKRGMRQAKKENYKYEKLDNPQ